MSIGLTLKNRLPNTSFMARNAAAIPPVPARNCRRLIPSFFAAESASFLDPDLDVLLLLCLRMRHVFAVGDHPRWNRGLEGIGFCRSASGEAARGPNHDISLRANLEVPAPLPASCIVIPGWLDASVRVSALSFPFFFVSAKALRGANVPRCPLSVPAKRQGDTAPSRRVELLDGGVALCVLALIVLVIVPWCGLLR